MTAQVVQFPAMANDVAAMLRKLAEEVEAGDFADNLIVVCAIHDDEDVQVRGLGDRADLLTCLGVLQVATTSLSIQKLDCPNA